MTPVFAWTIEAICQLAPRDDIAEKAVWLANHAQWISLGKDKQYAWGEYLGKAPYASQTVLDLEKFMQQGAIDGTCDCATRVSPCKHLLALAMIFLQAPERLTYDNQPDFVLAWQDNAPPDERKQKARQTRQQNRQDSIREGLDELEIWLRDILREGLSSHQAQQAAQWQQRAARMVDAQAPNVANTLNRIAATINDGQDWVIRVLHEIGQLQFLIEAYRQYDQSSPQRQADLRMALGWGQRQGDLEEEAVHDEWVVLDSDRANVDDNLVRQFTWLYGQHHQRYALVTDFASMGRSMPAHPEPTKIFWADMHYYRSEVPLRAIMKLEYAKPRSAMFNFTTLPGILPAIDHYREQLQKMPWLREYPFMLAKVQFIRKSEHTWIIRDPDNHILPLAPAFQQGEIIWTISQGGYLMVFGVWDGTWFWVRAIYDGHRMIAMSNL
ncbi:MAG: hypothetical protein ACLFTK_00035 [Anaerolineales bacterium]